jgi:hypothetical protein
MIQTDCHPERDRPAIHEPAARGIVDTRSIITPSLRAKGLALVHANHMDGLLGRDCAQHADQALDFFSGVVVRQAYPQGAALAFQAQPLHGR